MAGCLIAIWFFFGPVPDHRADTQLLVRQEWSHCADVVMIGDSSLEFGVRPEIVEAEQASPYRVVNFAELWASVSDVEYLDAAEAVLDPSSPHRTMVISINSA